MWVTTSNGIQMTVGDYGVELPITITGATIPESDSIKIKISNALGAQVLEKDYTNIQDNTVTLAFSEAESELFPVGVYQYSIDWYHDGSFMCNIIPIGLFKVVSKV